MLRGAVIGFTWVPKSPSGAAVGLGSFLGLRSGASIWGGSHLGRDIGTLVLCEVGLCAGN